MKLSFKWKITKLEDKNLDIIKDLQWHVKKVSNMLLYYIREGKEKIDVNKNLNIISSKIYSDYRRNNWHSNYLHSHMLQEAIIGVIASYKSYISLCNMYEKEEKAVLESNTNIMAIDLGLNNIVACTNKDNSNGLLVSGKEAKCKNKYINEKIRKLQQIQMKMEKTSKNFKNTKQINRLYEYRKNYMNTYMHKVSKMVIEYAKENKCVVIVIGDLKDIKQGMDYNKNFVQIPLHRLVQNIEYKAKLEGIKVEKISERYTSGVSALDKEDIIKENYNKKRRISRGMFVTNKGIKINADINGSLNILRKYIKLSKPNQEIVMDNGREQRPLKKRVA